jgi:ATP-dependent Lhr-like helicase
LPKGRLFPLSRDELVECVATLGSVRRGELDRLEIPEKPLDVLAQQIVACAACEDWEEPALFDLVQSAYPYRNLRREEFDDVLKMLADGFSTKRGRRGALVHHDAINHRVRGRRGARLIALTSGGAIPDNADYRVVLEPGETFIGTVNEDFAVESQAGDIFQLGNASWRIVRIQAGSVRVEDAHGQPPGIPFWLGEAPGRTREVSAAVSGLREAVEKRIQEQTLTPNIPGLTTWLIAGTGISESGARQLADYFSATYQALGVIPTQQKIVIERFFDESGGMQLVVHAPFGIRINRAWGLAWRKRFCRSFNFELQAAATDDAIVLSLGTQHSFPLDEVFRYLNSKTVRDLLVQALLDAPMFPIRWRWNATRALALPRQRGGRKVPAPLQRMESENLLAAVFPDQLACLEHIVGDREIPDHPLVGQTILDCLTEAMDVDGLIAVLKQIEAGEIKCIARDLPEPSPFAHEILHARPYAFLDNAPLEERRTQAVYTRRAGESSGDAGLGILDASAIERVCVEAWPRATDADELHEALLLAGAMVDAELRQTVEERPAAGTSPGGNELLDSLVREGRAGRLRLKTAGWPMRDFWIATERLPMLRTIYPESTVEPQIVAPAGELKKSWERAGALRELLRGRFEVSGPLTASGLAELFQMPRSEIDAALLALEAEGFILRGRFRPNAQELEWCDRRLLARIHRLTIHRLRAEIQPVSIADFQRFLLAWQRVGSEHRTQGPDGVEAVLELLDGYELPAAAWEPSILAARVNEYNPQWLDHLCFTGRLGWGRLTPPQNQKARAFSPLRSSPISLFTRVNLPHWLELARAEAPLDVPPDTESVLALLGRIGALFFGEIVRQSGLLPSRVEQALGELAALGWVTADSFDGLRALLIPSEKRAPFADLERKRRHKTVTSIEFAGRWSLLRMVSHPAGTPSGAPLLALDRQAPPHLYPPSAVLSTLRSAAIKDALEASATEDGLPRESCYPVLRRTGPLPQQAGERVGRGGEDSASAAARDSAIEIFARTLLRRYGVVFRRLLERETLNVSWFELGRFYRRLEARGEIRGGYFIGGVSGEQFALPEAIGLLRSIRKVQPHGELIALSAADPLNLVGILTPGPRVTAITANRVLLRDGVPLAALEAGRVIPLEPGTSEPDRVIEQALKIGQIPVALRPFYG